jgi:hypothetical protein
MYFCNRYCLSDECLFHISVLHGEIDVLIEGLYTSLKLREILTIVFNLTRHHNKPFVGNLRIEFRSKKSDTGIDDATFSININLPTLMYEAVYILKPVFVAPFRRNEEKLRFFWT